MTLFLENKYGNAPVLKTYRQPTWLFSHMTLFCYILGPAVMVAMWALMVTAFSLIYAGSGAYLLFLAILLVFQEFSWLFSKISYLKQDNCPGKCWRLFVWVDNWKRATEYLILGILAFILGGFTSWPSLVAGGLMLLLSAAYYLKAARFSKIVPLGEITTGAPAQNFTGSPTTAPSAPAPSDVEWGSSGARY